MSFAIPVRNDVDTEVTTEGRGHLYHSWLRAAMNILADTVSRLDPRPRRRPGGCSVGGRESAGRALRMFHGLAFCW